MTSRNGVVAADHETCSEIGADVLRRLDGSAVDAAVAVAFCLGVVNPTSSGIGGGAFMVVGSSATGSAKAYDMRETASSTAYQVLIITYKVTCFCPFLGFSTFCIYLLYYFYYLFYYIRSKLNEDF